MPTPPRRATCRDQRGAVALVVALSISALLFTAGIVLDIGLVRIDKKVNKSAADDAVTAGLQAANSGTGDVHNASAVCSAYEFLKQHRGLGGLPPGVCGSVSTTQTCTPGDAGTNVAYQGTATSGVRRYEVSIKMPYDTSDTSTGGAFADESSTTLSSDPGESTQQGCDQIGVVIKQWTQPGLSKVMSSDELVSRTRSVARVKVGNGDPAPALLLLERTACGVLTVGSSVSAARIKIYGSATAPGTIHSDSDATAGGCSNGSNSQLLQGKQANGVVAYGAANGVSGLITSVATQNGRSANVVADSPANVYATSAVNELTTGIKSGVTGRKAVTRKPVDRRYLRGVSAATMTASKVWGSSAPAGFTSYGCPTSANMTAMNAMDETQKVYIDCPGTSGITLSGSIGAGTIYFHGFIKGGSLRMPNATQIYIDNTDSSGNRINANAMTLSTGNTFCVRSSSCTSLLSGMCNPLPTGNPAAKAQIVIRRGALNGTGGSLLRLCQTSVILEGGDVGDGTATKPGGCLPTTQGSAPTSIPCASTTATSKTGDGLLSTSGLVDWTPPNAYGDMTAAGLSVSAQQTVWAGGEDLAFWSETHGTSTDFSMSGGGDMRISGIFMVPNAFPFNLSGTGDLNLTNAQYVVRGFSLGGGATLTMTVDPHNVVGMPNLYDFRLVR